MEHPDAALNGEDGPSWCTTNNKQGFCISAALNSKLQQPDVLESLNPDLVNLAVKNSKETIKASNDQTKFAYSIVPM